MNTVEQILHHKIVAIVRGAEPSDVLKIATALYEGGVTLMEVTLNSKNALQLIKELTVQMKGKMLIGAGTVLNIGDAQRAIEAGARFIISPIVDVQTIQFTRQNKIASIPGAYTATEIHQAYTNGADIVKIFPASSNYNYIKELRGPLPHIPMMPTGGITVDNIGDFLKAGAAAFGIGTALVDTKQQVTDDYLEKVKEKAKRFIQAIKNTI